MGCRSGRALPGRKIERSHTRALDAFDSSISDKRLTLSSTGAAWGAGCGIPSDALQDHSSLVYACEERSLPHLHRRGDQDQVPLRKGLRRPHSCEFALF